MKLVLDSSHLGQHVAPAVWVLKQLRHLSMYASPELQASPQNISLKQWTE
jgi:hypothetical protein